MSAQPGEFRRTPLRRRLLWGAGIGSGSGILAIVFSFLAPTFENRSLDMRYRLLSRPTAAVDGVAVVLIDSSSVERLAAEDQDWRWPWPREFQAYIVKYLKLAGAKAVLFDVLFGDLSRVGADDDRGFGEALREAGNVYLGSKLEEKAEEGKKLALPELDPAVIERSAVSVTGWRHTPRKDLERPIPLVPEIAAGAAGIGVINVVQDVDNTIRGADLLFPCGNRIIPSLGFAGARAALDEKGGGELEGRWLRFGGRWIPLEPDGRLLLRFYGPELTFPTYPAINLIKSWSNHEEGKPPVPGAEPEKFKDRVVFVALQIAGNEDIVTAPTSTRLPGVEIHATLCANISSGEFLRRPTPWARLALIGLVALATGLAAFAAWRPLRAALAALSLGAAWTAAAAVAFSLGLVLDVFYPLFGCLLAYVGEALAGYLGEGREKRRVSQAFGQYLSPVVIRDLMKDPQNLRLGGETREITVFFSDIQGFSTFSEGMTPAELVSFLNLYLGAMTDVILEHRGVVDKYEGDAIMAFWGAPERLSNDAELSCRAALRQREALEELNRRFLAEGRPQLRIRAGLNRGPAVVGNMGSAKRFAYTAMGDTVNLASRLEGANKFFGTSLMVSESVRAAAGGGFVTRRLGRIRVVGKAIPTEVHELVGFRESVPREILRRIELHESALGLLEKGDPAAAAARLDEALSISPDPASERARAFALDRAARKSVGWDGIWELTAK